MNRIARAIGSFVLAAVAGVFALSLLGAVDLRWPWTPDILTQDLAVGAPSEAAIVEIEPITLDCRARIHAVVPVEGVKEHRMFGQVYRTDRVTLDAVGDIDTCVDATAVEVVNRSDGSTRVLVPADAIEFVRPRVDAEQMLGSVRYDKGVFGKLTDAFPWVDDSEGLTAAGYAFAQQTIGSSQCMAAAFDQTTEALDEAYRRQADAVGRDPEAVTVDIIGEPDFTADPNDALESYDFTVGRDVACVVTTGDGEPGKS